jgi:hypothetical protein
LRTANLRECQRAIFAIQLQENVAEARSVRRYAEENIAPRNFNGRSKLPELRS